MTEQYNPTEEQIARVLAKTQDPRALAIAYLRTQHRVQDAHKALKLHEDLDRFADKLTRRARDRDLDEALTGLFRMSGGR